MATTTVNTARPVAPTPPHTLFAGIVAVPLPTPADALRNGIGIFRGTVAAVSSALRRDADLHAVAAEFRQLHTALNAIPYADEDAVSAAWDARQRAAERLMGLRPVTTAGRCAKAAVGALLMEEVAKWERGPEWAFALAAFRAEAGA